MFALPAGPVESVAGFGSSLIGCVRSLQFRVTLVITHIRNISDFVDTFNNFNNALDQLLFLTNTLYPFYS